MLLPRKLKNPNDGQYFDTPPSCIKSLDTHYSDTVIYPHICDNKGQIVLAIPVLYRVGKNRKLHSLFIEKTNQSRIRNISISNNIALETEALRIMESSGLWEPGTLDGKYVDLEYRQLIKFTYHPEYFNIESEPLELNPDIRPRLLQKEDLHGNSNLKFGHDGQVSFLVVIEKNGSISNEFLLSGSGKINLQIATDKLQQIHVVAPAIKRGKFVRSQTTVTVYN